MTHSSDELSTVSVAEKHVSALICGQQKQPIIDVSDHPAASDKQHLSGVITAQIKDSTQSYDRQSDSLFNLMTCLFCNFRNKIPQIHFF